MIKTVTVSDKGQIIIPISIRKMLGIKKGDELVVIQADEKILLEKVQQAETKLKEDFKDILTFSEQALSEVWDNSDDEVLGQYLKRQEN